jgi:hypothetical protein
MTTGDQSVTKKASEKVVDDNLWYQLEVKKGKSKAKAIQQSLIQELTDNNRRVIYKPEKKSAKHIILITVDLYKTKSKTKGEGKDKKNILTFECSVQIVDLSTNRIIATFNKQGEGEGKNTREAEAEAIEEIKKKLKGEIIKRL